jgi:ribonuclease HI
MRRYLWISGSSLHSKKHRQLSVNSASTASTAVYRQRRSQSRNAADLFHLIKRQHSRNAAVMADQSPAKVSIYTDGACRGNPGPGGYGVILVSGKNCKELSAGYKRTTNNRMELLAAIVGLEALKARCDVALCSDSSYLVDAINKNWIGGWRAKGWSRGKAGVLKNADLWQRLDAIRQKHSVTWQWVRGHAGHAQNERCDVLATEAADGPGRLRDEGFEAAEALALAAAQDDSDQVLL